MSAKQKLVAQNPLILRCHRLMEAFAKSDDERDFYLDRQEGFLLYIDLDKSQEELDELARELESNPDRYYPVPKLTFYEVKKTMEGFVNEKVYDIDTKEKLLDIIQSKEARENFLEFIYDHHTEFEKWQQFYQERFRVRIIEWLRNNYFEFVFEEDLEVPKSMVEKIKINLFVQKAPKDVLAQRKLLMAKAKTYYSSEALNPRPKRGRPPKQIAKVEAEPQFSQDIYTTLSKVTKPFLFSPDYHSSSAIFTFSGKFNSEADLLAHRRQQLAGSVNLDLQNLSQKLAALRSISTSWNIAPVELSSEIKIGAFEEENHFSSRSFDETTIPLLTKEVSAKSPKKTASTPPPRAEKSEPKLKEVKKAKAAPSVKPKKPQKKLSAPKPTSKAAVKKVAPKPSKKAKPTSKSSPPKARLRTLSKKEAPAQAPKGKKSTKATTPPLRMLRRAKKR
jgi:hypothetical protein